MLQHRAKAVLLRARHKNRHNYNRTMLAVRLSNLVHIQIFIAKKQLRTCFTCVPDDLLHRVFENG